MADPLLMVMADSAVYWYLMVFLDSLGRVGSRTKVLIGDLGLEPAQVDVVRGFGDVVPLKRESTCLKAEFIQRYGRGHQVLYMDADMLALTDPGVLLRMTRRVGVCPDPCPLEEMVPYYFTDNVDRYTQLAELAGKTRESLVPINSGLLALQPEAIEDVTGRWLETTRKLVTLQEMGVPLRGTLKHRPVSDQLALMLTLAGEDIDVFPQDWNMPPTVAKAKVVHYVNGRRPMCRRLGQQNPHTLGDQKNPLIVLWKTRAAELMNVLEG